jgi:hypothetical protein
LLSFTENNFFSGTLPSEFGKLSSLATLDVSFNSMDGTIPAAFAGLSLLSKLVVDALCGSV